MLSTELYLQIVTVRRQTNQFCVIFYCIMYIVSYYIILYYILYCIALHYIILYYIILRCVILYYIILYYIISYYINVCDYVFRLIMCPPSGHSGNIFQNRRCKLHLTTHLYLCLFATKCISTKFKTFNLKHFFKH